MVEIEFAIIIIILIIVFVISLYTKYENRKKLKGLNEYLKTLEKFEIDLDTIKVDGFHWQENIPVDVYDNELKPYNDNFYGRRHNLKGKFHKQKNLTKFKTKLYITVNHLNSEYHYTTSLPTEHTNIRMKFYTQKKTNVYIGKTENEDSNGICFLFDFRFIKNSRNYLFSTKPFFY